MNYFFNSMLWNISRLGDVLINLITCVAIQPFKRRPVFDPQAVKEVSKILKRIGDSYGMTIDEYQRRFEGLKDVNIKKFNSR